MRILLQASAIFLLSFSNQLSFSQSISQRLTQAVRRFESDPQMRHAITSLYVIDAKTGKKVYGRNEQIGLAPASTQKLFTSAAALEMLGGDFRYKTELGYTGKIEKGELIGNLVVLGSGDPTFGSWRWKETVDSVILQKWLQAIRKEGITKRITGTVIPRHPKFTHQAIPNGWIWEDIGNYYGAGAYAINWRENQYDLILRSGTKPGDSVWVVESRPVTRVYTFYENELRAGPKGSGDNAFIYQALPGNRHSLLRGTIPAGEKSFSISGAEPDPVTDFLSDMSMTLLTDTISIEPLEGIARDLEDRSSIPKSLKVFASHTSPSLDSINYYFLRRSVNLYGEALVKTIALEKSGLADFEEGINIIKSFWSDIGIDKAAINIIDGSGLSPQNRVTTHAEVKVLQYARTRPWFQSFYNALPEYNGMKMKSGSIGGARAYAGYHKAKDGNEYIFSIIVNNYDGSAGEVVRKMYKILNELK